ncbi:MAG: stage V sporulation T C-terminal domain-containing protein [Bacilli bacterium]
MKTTGVSRRIDELGRIVIPKEIRKNLRIRSGETLDILVNDEAIILAKQSSINGFEDMAKKSIDAVNEVLNTNILITNRDRVVAASSPIYKKYYGKDLNPKIIDLMLQHSIIIEKNLREIAIIDEFTDNASYILNPIIVDGDVAGLVIALGFNDKVTELDEKIVKIISKIIESNISL